MFENDGIIEEIVGFVSQDLDSLRERRLAFRRRSTMKNGKTLLNSASEYIPPHHPVHFQDRSSSFSSLKGKDMLGVLDVIVCLHAHKSSPTIGLRNFLMPLRASSFQRHELPIIIFVTDLDYIRNEWDMICTFPDIYILNVNSIEQLRLFIFFFKSHPFDFRLGFTQ